jgi:hypothetical protein
MKIKRPTLDEFITATLKDPLGASRAYVKEAGFERLYVRLNGRFVDDGIRWPTLDLANLAAKKPGSGTFTALVERLRHTYPQMTLYVESVPEARFQAKLRRMGFKPVCLHAEAKTEAQCFVLCGDATPLSSDDWTRLLSELYEKEEKVSANT